MNKLREGFKMMLRNLEEFFWKKNCKEFKNFQLYEDGCQFTIVLKFSDEFSAIEKEKISEFLECALKKEEVDILIALEVTRQKFNVGVAAQGADGSKILIFVKKW